MISAVRTAPVKVGLLLRTGIPVPVAVEEPVPPDEMGMGVAEVRVWVAMEVAVAFPRVGVTRTGEVLRTTAPVPVDVVTPVPPEVTGTGAVEVNVSVATEVALRGPTVNVIGIEKTYFIECNR